MEFDPESNVVKLCAEGMSMEGQGKPDEANRLFLQAWSESTDDFEKFIAAHYVARHQRTVSEKLRWDEVALRLALKVDSGSGASVEEFLPSLYLNVAACYEKLNDFDSAIINYELASSYAHSLQGDGYGQMIRAGIAQGIARVTQ